MSLKSCLKAGINLSEEDTSAVLDGYDSYSSTMSQKEATVLAVEDALTSARAEREATLGEINNIIGVPEFDMSQMEQLFAINDDTVMVPVEDIRARDSASPQASIDNAKSMMHRAVAGEFSPRQPLTAWEVTSPDGNYYSLRDGNTTYQILQESGFTEVPMTVERTIAENEMPPVEAHGSTDQNIPLNELGTFTEAEVKARTAAMKKAQAGWGIEETYAKAVENQQYLNSVGKSIERVVDVKYKSMPPSTEVGEESVAGEKTHASALKKINGPKYNGDASQMTDIVRGTFAVKHPDEVAKIVKELGKRFYGVDEGYAANPTSYFDRKILVQFDNGQIGEIQIVAPELLWFKEGGKGHAMYKASQDTVLETNPETGEKEPIKGWEYIHMTMVNSMTKGYSEAIGTETDQRWFDIYVQTLRSQISPDLADNAIAIAKEAQRIKALNNPMLDPHTGYPVEGSDSDIVANLIKGMHEETVIDADGNLKTMLRGSKINPDDLVYHGWSTKLNVQAGELRQRSPRVKSPPAKGMDVKTVQAFIDTAAVAMPDLGGKIDVQIFQTQKEAFGKELVDDEGKPIVIQGGFFSGTNQILLIAENIASEKDLQTVLRHEFVGHFGLRELLNSGGRYSQLLARVWDSRNGEMREEADWVAANYPDLLRAIEEDGSSADIEIFADEMLARAAEINTGQATGLLQRFYDLLQKWLNQIGLAPTTISQKELKSLIRSSELRLRRQILRKRPSGVFSGESGGEVFRNRQEVQEYMAALEKGLDMSYAARLDRARKMGYDTSIKFYHGTYNLQRPLKEVAPDLWVEDADQAPSDFDSFELDFKGIGRDFISLSPEPSFAGQFTGTDPLGKSITRDVVGSPRIIPVYAKTEKTFDYDNVTDAERKAFIDYASAPLTSADMTSGRVPSLSRSDAGNAFDRTKLGDWSMIESPAFQKWLRHAGYDSFYAMEGGVKTLAVLDPSQLRSIHAAFDPDYMDSSNLLARRSTGKTTDIQKGSAMDIYRREQQKRPIVGNVMEPIRNKDGEYRRNANGDITGAPEGVKTQEAIDNIVTVNVVHMESDAAQMPMSAEWYNVSGAAIREITHGDPELTEKIVRIAAVLSAANQVGGNTTGFIKAAYQMATGEPVAAGRFPNVIREAMPEVLAAKDMNFSLPQVEAKVMSFYRNLWDATFQSDKYQGAVTMDMWMARLFGYKGDTFGPAQYRFASMITRNIAEAYNASHGTTLTPDQVQAVLWVYARNTQAMLERGTPIPLSDRSGFDTYIERAKQHITFEAVPSVDSGLFPELHDMGFAQKQEYTKQAVGLILNEDGQNELFERIGIPLYTSSPSEGTFEGAVSPNTIMSGVSKGGGTPDTTGIDLASRALAYIYTQDGVPWFQLNPSLTGATRGVAIRFAEQPTVEMEEAFLPTLNKYIDGADFTRIGNDFFLLNFTSLSNKKFIDGVTEAAERYEGVGKELFENAEIKTDVKAKGDYIATDWTNPEAAIAETESLFNDAGRSDLLDFLRDRREAVGRLQESFAKSEGVAPPFDPAKMLARRGGDETATPQFKAWSGNAEVIPDSEVNSADLTGEGPFVLTLWHGTTHDLELFDAKQYGNQEAQFGQNNYFSSDFGDALVNYTDNGPDIRSRIDRLADQIFDNPDNDGDSYISRSEAEAMARERLTGKAGDRVLKLYVKTEKPFVINQAPTNPMSFAPHNNDRTSPFVDLVDTETITQDAAERVAEENDVSVESVLRDSELYEEELTEARYDILGDQPNLLIDAINTVAMRHGYKPDVLLEGLWNSGLTNEDSVRTSEIEDFMRYDSGFQNTMDYDTNELMGSQLLAEVIQEMGYDSIILKNAENRFNSMGMKKDTTHVTVFNQTPSNIKVARHAYNPAPENGYAGEVDENSGAFDPNDPRIRFRQIAQEAQDAPMGQSLGMPEEGWRQRFTRFFRDNFNRLLTLQETLAEQGGTVNYDSDVYAHEIRSSGQKTARLKQIERRYQKPLIEVMKKHNLTMEDLDRFLIARHAQERNEYIASINPDMQDGGSGMLTDDADAILYEYGDIRPELEEAADIIYKLNDAKLDDMVDAGHITQEYADSLRARWNYYVPLKGKDGEESRPGVGSGFSGVTSGIQRAMGRGTGNMPESPTAHSFADAAATVIRSENTKVGQALVNLVVANPDENFWTLTERNFEQFEDMFGRSFEGWTEEPAGLIERTDYRRVMSTTAAERKAAKAEGRAPVATVHYAVDPSYRNRADVFTVMKDGKELMITIKDPIVMEQLKRLSTSQMNGVIAGLGTVNRYLAMVSTALNPEFVITNFERDFQTAMVHLGGEHSAAIAARVAKGIPSAVRGIWQSTFDTKGDSEWRALFEEMEMAGGTIGFFGLEDIETKVKKMKKSLDMSGGPIKTPMKGLRWLREIVLDANLTIENAARLSAYKVIKEEGLKSGLSEKEARGNAAVVAKELTVNFNRKGELGPALNSIYLFYNATIQGTFRMLGAIGSSPRVRKIVGGIMATSFALALFNRGAGGDDDDGIPYWDKYSDYTKQTHLIILDPVAKDGTPLLKVRLPYGYNVFHYTGETMADLMFNKRASVVGSSMKLLAAAANAFNPIQGSDLIDTIMPTFLKPHTQVAQNKNFMGGPIVPEFPFDNYDRPESQKYFKSTNPQLRELMIALNEATGGDSTHSGIIDMSPEVLKHYVKWLTGGMGSTVMRTVGTATNMATGEPNDPRNIPFLRQFSGSPSSRFDSERFYESVRAINAVEAGLKERLGTKDWKDYQQKHSEVHKLSLRMKGVKKIVKHLRSQRDAAYAADDIPKADEIREQIRQKMIEFSMLYEDAVEADNE